MTIMPPSTTPETVPRVLALVFTDLEGSLELKVRLGDAVGAGLIARHYAISRRLAATHAGREIFSSGDGLFLTFEVPSAAVRYALALQSAHAAQADLPKVRVGIHVGEVTVRPADPATGGALGVDGLAADMASRLQALALPGQIVLSHPAFDNARQRLEPADGTGAVAWVAHGRYAVKGEERPIAVFEVGLEGVAPLKPPPDTDKARRLRADGADGDGDILGWRPAQGLAVPGRDNWTLDRKLGEGGFGEVWMATQRRTRDSRVFKFCYSADRLRGLKRELMVFRVLRESLGERDDIVRVIDWRFHEAPFFLEMEYAGPGNLADWARTMGGLPAVDFGTRLEIVARAAEAIAAAHRVGVLHKDVKPDNIMIDPGPDPAPGTTPKVKVIDFGIGAIVNRGVLAERGITVESPTHGASAAGGDAFAGTRLYMAPELLEGKPATTRSDIHALGVLLYQMAVGDLTRALATGWERDIDDPLLRADIAACVDGDPARRLETAGELAHCLGSLPQRRAAAESARAEAERSTRERADSARLRRRLRATTTITLAVVGIASAIAWVALEQSRLAATQTELRDRAQTLAAEAVRQHAEAVHERAEADRQRELATVARRKAEYEQYAYAVGYADSRLRDNRLLQAWQYLRAAPAEFRGWEWGRMACRASRDTAKLTDDAFHAEFSPAGRRVATAGGRIRMFDAATGDALAWNGPVSTAGFWTVRFNRDGTRLAASGFNGESLLIDARDGTTLTVLRGHAGFVRGIDFDPDGARIATASRDGTARIWDASDGRELLRITTPGGSPYDIRFSPDGLHVATSCLGGAVMIWNSSTGAAETAATTHPRHALSVRYAPDGRHLVTSCLDGRIRVIDTDTGRLTDTIDAEGSLNDADISRDGLMVAAAGDNGMIRVWDLATHAIIHEALGEEPIRKVGFDPTGTRLTAVSRQSARVYDIDPTRDRPARLDLSDATTVTAPGTAIRVTGLSDAVDPTWSSKDRRFSTPTGRTLYRTAGGDTLGAVSPWGAYSADGRLRVAYDDRTTVTRLIDMADGRVIATPGGGAPARDAAFSPDGRFVAIVYVDGPPLLHSTGDGAAVATLDPAPGLGEMCFRVWFSPNGSRMAVAARQGSRNASGHIVILDAGTGEPVADIRTKPGYMPLAAAFSPDGARLATGWADDKIRLWDTARGELVTSCSGHARPIYALEWNRQGDRVFSTGGDAQIKLWDAATGREMLNALSADDQDLVLGMGMAADGLTLFYVCESGRAGALQAFPWRDADYAGAPGESHDARFERVKRRMRAVAPPTGSR